jgi:antitoxin component HigA of HigAB toxin-antitoxin module
MAYTRYRVCNFGLAYAGALANAGFALAGAVAWSAVSEIVVLGVNTGAVGATISFPDGYAGPLVWTPDRTATPVKYAIEEVNPGADEFTDVKVSTSVGTPAPTAAQIRQEMDVNSLKLAMIDASISSRSTYGGTDTPGTTTLLTYLTSTRAGKLDFLDAAISSRLAAASYTAAPSVTLIRQEMDSNSTRLANLTGDAFVRIGAAGAGLTALGDARLANLNATVSSRSTYGGGDTAGVTTLLTYLTPTRATKLDFLDAAVSSRLATAGYTVPNTVAPPTVVQIRQEMDTNSTKLANLNATISSRSTYAGGDTSGVTTLLTYLTPTRATKLDFLDVSVASRLAASAYAAPNTVTPPTVAQIRQEMDANSTKLANLDVAVSTRLATASVPTVVQIRQEMDANSTKLANLNATISSRSTYAGADTPGTTTLLTYLTSTRATKLDFLDAAVSSRLAAASYTAPPAYTTPPTVVQIRQEMDANSTKLANLNATVSSRSTYAGTDTAGVTTLLTRLDAGRALKLDNLDVAISTRLATTGYTPPPASSTPPTVVQIRQEMDTNSSKLANLDAAVSSRSTYAGIDTAGTSTLLLRLTSARALLLDNLNATVSSRLAAASYTTPPTPPTVVQIRQEMDANSTKLANLDAAVSTRSTYAGGDSSGVTTLLTRLSAVRAGYLDNLAPGVLGGLVGGPIPTTAQIVTALYDSLVVNTTTFRTLLSSVAAVSCGNVVENADHTTTSFTDINDPGGVVRVDSVNSPTTREVSIH